MNSKTGIQCQDERIGVMCFCFSGKNVAVQSEVTVIKTPRFLHCGVIILLWPVLGGPRCENSTRNGVKKLKGFINKRCNDGDGRLGVV